MTAAKTVIAKRRHPRCWCGGPRAAPSRSFLKAQRMTAFPAFSPFVRSAQMPEGGKITLHDSPCPKPPPARHLAQAQLTDQIERPLLRNLQRLLDHPGRHQRTRQDKFNEIRQPRTGSPLAKRRSICPFASISRSCSLRPSFAASWIASSAATSRSARLRARRRSRGICFCAKMQRGQMMRRNPLLAQQRGDQQRPEPSGALHHLNLRPGFDEDRRAQHDRKRTRLDDHILPFGKPRVLVPFGVVNQGRAILPERTLPVRIMRRRPQALWRCAPAPDPSLPAPLTS